MTYDAIIAGYGPVGATMANLLGRHGWRVAVVERNTTICNEPKAITADHEAMRVFQEIELANEIAPRTIPHPGTDFLGVDGQPIKYFHPAPPPRLLGWEPNFMFFQPELERVLREGVARYSNVDVMLGRPLADVTHDEESVRATVGTDVLRAKFLVACDGASSTVRRELRAPIDDLAFDEGWVVVDTKLTGHAQLPERVIQYCRPDRPGSYVVGPDRLRRWEFKILPGEKPADFEDNAKLHEVLDTFVDVTKVEIQRVAVYRFHALVVSEWRHGRIFLMGDAAHQMPPFLGQGMCAGIRDTVNLAWKLDGVQRQGWSSSLLETYGEERIPHVRAVVKTAKSFGLIIGELDPDRCAERDESLRAQLETAKAIRQDFIPGLTSGLVDLDGEGNPGIGAGELFPQPEVSPGVLMDSLLGPGFALVVVVKTLLDNDIRRTWAVVRGRTLHVTERIDSNRLVLDWAERLDATAIIVRPDRYVFGTARDSQGLRALVARLVHRLET